MEEQDRLLECSTLIVREQSYFMKKAIEQENMREALKYASNMLAELRSVNLSPRFYYELYMQIFQELQGSLYTFFNDHSKHGKRLSELYETAQHAGNILPRLYLVLTVGVCYMESQEITSPIEILYDMVELCKGVQNPIRGLFLRYFLLQMTKDKLMRLTEIEMLHQSSSTHTRDEILEKVCDYLLLNFRESTRLWNRLMDPTAATRKEKERYDLRLLVGTSLVGISQLEGISQSFYLEKILPRILDQIVECNKIGDFMAAHYILDCTVQIFPDEYHLGSLQLLLLTCSQIDGNSSMNDLRPILTNLMNRLGAYLQTTSRAASVDDEEIFTLFKNYLEKILVREVIAANQNSPIGGILELYNSFLTFTLSLNNGGKQGDVSRSSEIIRRISAIHAMTIAALNKYIISTTGNEQEESDAPVWLCPLLSILETTIGNMELGVVLNELYPHFSTLVRAVPVQFSEDVLTAILDALLVRSLAAPSTGITENILRRFMDLVVTKLFARTTHTAVLTTKLNKALRYLIAPGDAMYENILVAKSHLDDQSGMQVMIYLQLASLCIDGISQVGGTRTKKFFQLLHSLLVSAGQRQHDEQSIPNTPVYEQLCDMWLGGCLVAHKLALEAIAVEFLTQCVVLLCEAEIGGKTGGLQEGSNNPVVFANGGNPMYSLFFVKVIGVINKIFRVQEEGRDAYYADVDRIAVRVLQLKSSFSLLNKFDQCIFIVNCSFLFQHRNEQYLVDCLQKSLKLAESSSLHATKSLYLFVLILNKYMYFKKTTPVIRAPHIASLVALCREHANLVGASCEPVTSFLNETVEFEQGTHE